MQEMLPLLDRSIYALVTDLRERGLDQDVAVVVMGEFGRTPKINGNAGRDHWNEAGCVLLAGGGLRMGQVIGTTDSRGERSRSQPIRYQNIFATLYHVLSIDPGQTLPDLGGRPCPCSMTVRRLRSWFRRRVSDILPDETAREQGSLSERGKRCGRHHNAGFQLNTRPNLRAVQ
jgi:hypothetical protein